MKYHMIHNYVTLFTKHSKITGSGMGLRGTPQKTACLND